MLLEEAGHRIVGQLNQQDTLGDEGELFSALVREENLDEQQLITLQSEDDTV